MDKLFDKEKEIMDIFWTANQPYLISDVLKSPPRETPAPEAFFSIKTPKNIFKY